MANQSPLKRLLPALGVTALMFAARLAQADDYDLVILNGRVMDPETNFDELRSGGVIIAHFTAQSLALTETAMEYVDAMRAKGVHVVLEVYPYNFGAAGNGVSADYLKPANYQRSMGRSYKDLIDTQTGKPHITVFDPETVTDNSSLKQGKNALPSTGIPYVLVNGTVVVKGSKVLKDVFPGQAIRAPIRN